ncbi:restriction endonuclease [Streptomyces lunaelactis]|uniref:restriction endonuclease n=1 Tax=Streptomyces lunaelactis TaxID=1535768 RepID=UPI0015848E97|nr:restriction endonuclease [Streptomyces lunaelactis]NUK02009.1 restriction endonuclease [Streptomyces lunaelactis]NUK18501.1 restriction endonuclease [Streptomyces lunaelactis]
MTPPAVTEPLVSFEDLGAADLAVDALYAGGTNGHSGDDPMSKLIPGIGNQGGFRYAGSPARGTVKLVVLYTSGDDVDWPDHLDMQTGTFTYYGDNKKPGQDLHTTPRSGNALLRDAFAASHGTTAERAAGVRPFLLFEKAGTSGRSVRFRGLLAPGGPAMTSDDELAAIWRATAGHRFQNYRSQFTVLDHATIPRTWIQHLLDNGNPLEGGCPDVWRTWIEGRVYRPLLAPATTVIRTKAAQLPDDPVGQAMLEAIRDYFRGREHDFEACAVAIWRLMAPNTGAVDVTRPSRDGGRDAVGTYSLGPTANRIAIDFALEAKCYAHTNSVGVREVSRLISRIRHRNFGVLLTTSYFHRQVQEEVQEDGHPISLICGRDITDALRQHGRTTTAAVQQWLSQSFPVQSA